MCFDEYEYQMTATLNQKDDLFAAMASGDEAAFRAVYATYGKLVFAIALRILRDRSAAEDAAQETFVKLWRTAARFDPNSGSARSWIAVIARNSALDLVRKRRPMEEFGEEEIASIVTEAVDPPDLKLGRCLARLPADQAKAIVTIYTYGMSHSELSEHLNIPIGTVKSWIRRGTSALKICMES
jgi:RNA polymerase sigma-70 factor (ECF subfamily)